MKFTRIQLRGLAEVNLNVVGVSPTDPYVLKAADGLGPPEVAVSISSTQQMGGVYQGRRPLSREITLRVGLNPDYSANQNASDLRRTLYGLLTPGDDDKVYVNIIDDDAESVFIMGTVGWVKRLEVVPFSKDPEVQITIACEKPYFNDGSTFTTIPGVGTRIPLEFDNVGTAESGLILNVQFTGGVERFEFQSISGEVIMRLVRPGGFPNGALMNIDTRPGTRGIVVSGGGIPSNETNHVWIMSSTSKWPMSHGGQNYIKGTGYASNGGTSTGWTWGNVFYAPRHWGI